MISQAPARRAWRAAGRVLGRRLLTPIAATRLRRLHAGAGRGLEGAFYVIAPPGSWALLRPCLHLALQGTAPVCVVDNGVDADERASLAATFPRLPRVRLPVLPGTFWAHGTVLTLLVRQVAGSFGVLDHDCFVFDDSLLGGLSCGNRELALAVEAPGFFTWNERAQLRFPRTHWLYLNAALLRDLMRRRRLDCEKQTRTPGRVADLLHTIDIGNDNFPPHLPFYDTLQLVVAVGLAEGASVRYVRPRAEGIVHFGGATRQRA